MATYVNCGRIFIDFFTASLLQSVMVKEFGKSVSISQSYRQNYSGTFFPDTMYICLMIDVYVLYTRIHVQLLLVLIVVVDVRVRTLSVHVHTGRLYASHGQVMLAVP